MIKPTGARSAGAGWLCAHMHTVQILCHSRFGVLLCPYEGRDNPVEIHTETPEGLSVFPLLYSSEFYSFFVWEFSNCLMISLAPTPTLSWPDVYNSSIWTSVDLPVLLLHMWHNLFFSSIVSFFCHGVLDKNDFTDFLSFRNVHVLMFVIVAFKFFVVF